MALRKGGARSATASRRGQALGAKGEAAMNRKRGKDWLSIPDGETVIGRVLPETFKEVEIHRTPIEVEQEQKSGRKRVVTKEYDVPCLDQDNDGTPCPGCADELDKRYKFYVWVIVRGDPDADDKTDQKDRLMAWSGGIKLFRQLNKKHKSRGLENRDVEISRSGEGFDTEYEVEWADEKNVPLTANDKKLIAANKETFDFYITPPEYDEFYLPPSERSKDKDEDDEDQGQKSLRRGSPLGGKKTTSARSSTKKTGLAKLQAERKRSGTARTGSSKTTKKVIRRKGR